MLVGITLNSLETDEHRQVSWKDGELFCKDHLLDYFTEINAMNLEEIDSLFDTVNRALVAKEDERISLDWL